MKVSELTGELLDYWVAKAEGHEVDPPLAPGKEWPDREKLGRKYEPNYIAYSTLWQFGGPIIERERIMLVPDYGAPWAAMIGAQIEAGEITESRVCQYGNTYLIAGMRAFVCAKFGNEVPDL